MSDDFELFGDTPAPPVPSGSAPANSAPDDDLFFDDNDDSPAQAAAPGISMKERVLQYLELFAVDETAQTLIRANSAPWSPRPRPWSTRPRIGSPASLRSATSWPATPAPP
ncbi:MAG: hypothetical protein NVV74_18135 [Magnetospirillum sp.]|nr:hypothetical protein [Magnetospirillum sp.]